MNAKITEIDSKIPSITSLGTNSALTIENKILDVSGLVTKKDYDTKISETEKSLVIKITTNTLLLQNLIF